MADPTATNVVVAAETVCAIDFQTAKGTEVPNGNFVTFIEKGEDTEFAVFEDAVLWQARGINIGGDVVGNAVRKGHRHPGARLATPANQRLLAILFESLFVGRTHTIESQITEANDDANQLSVWAFTGPRVYYNTDANRKLYVTLADAAGTRTVSIFKDAAKLNKVAEGSKAGDGEIELAEQNNSGLSGTVTVAYSGDDSDIQLTIKRVNFDYTTLDYSDNSFLSAVWDIKRKLYKSYDLVVSKLTLDPQATGCLMVLADLLGLNWATPIAGGVLTEALPDQTYALAAECQITRSPGGGSTILAPESGPKLEITNNLRWWPKSGADHYTGVKSKGRNWKLMFSGALCDETGAVIDDALGLVKTDFRWRFTYGSNLVLNVELANVLFDPANVLPELKGRELTDPEFDGEATADGASAAITAYLQYEA